MDIKPIMKLRGMTFEQLAEKMGQTKGTLNASVGKNGNPTLKKLETIAQHLDCSVADFFTDSDTLDGFVEYRGTVHRIKSVEDLKRLLDLVVSNKERETK